MRIVIGVDAGASKTHALLLEESGQTLGFHKAGCGNHQTHGLAPAVTEIDKAVRGALGEQQLPVDAACFCLAGADLEEDFIMLQDAMQGLNVARSVLVKNDTFAAMRAGLSRSWGVAVVCGTGFNAAARSPEGRELALPSLGAISGDWGGGWDLALEIIHLVMRAEDGRGNPTQLTALVLEKLKLPSIDVLLRKLYRSDIPDQEILGLVPLLFEAAVLGDEVARDLVIRMGLETGVTARSLIRRCGLEALDPEVILGGSIFKCRGSLLLDTIRKDIGDHYPGVQVKRPRYEPVVGAALLALESIGAAVDSQALDRLNDSLPDLLKINPEKNQEYFEHNSC